MNLWQGWYGHEEVVERFRRALASRRLASTFLLVGPPGVGKRTFAGRLTQALLCEATDPWQLDACGACEGCLLLLAGNHPDVEVVEKPADKSVIPLELLIGDREHRGRSGLCHAVARKPRRGGRRIAIIDDADDLNDEGANALLKTLEEPPPNALLLLIGTSEQSQLPTIRSRSQVVRFRPLPEEIVARLLVEQGVVADGPQAAAVASLADGSLQRAREMVDEPLQQFRASLLQHLADGRQTASKLAADVLAFVDQTAAKDSAAKRGRLRQVIAVAREFYRQLLRDLCGAETRGDERLLAAVAAARARWARSPQAPQACLEQCLAAERFLDGNANQATLVEAWLDELLQQA